MPYPQFLAGKRLTAGMLASVRPIYVVKAGNEQRVNTVTPTADSELFVDLAASSRYHIIMLVQFAGTAGSLGIQGNWAIPVGSTITSLRAAWGPESGSTDRNNTNVRLGGHAEATPAVYGNIHGVGLWSTLKEEFVIDVASAGRLNWQWAQHTSHADPAEIRSGSLIRAELIG